MIADIVTNVSLGSTADGSLILKIISSSTVNGFTGNASYLGKISLQSKKQLVEIFRTCQKNVKLNVVFRSSNRIQNAFRFKDAIPSYMNSKVIYKYKCNICNDVYIGETKRHLLVRQYEHIGKSILTEKPLKYNEKDATAIRKHCHHSNHQPDINCFLQLVVLLIYFTLD